MVVALVRLLSSDKMDGLCNGDLRNVSWIDANNLSNNPMKLGISNYSASNCLNYKLQNLHEKPDRD